MQSNRLFIPNRSCKAHAKRLRAWANQSRNFCDSPHLRVDYKPRYSMGSASTKKIRSLSEARKQVLLNNNKRVSK